MSWSDRSHAARPFAIALALLALAACGFQPLYRQDSRSPVVPQMTAIAIQSAPDRLHQLVRNQVYDRLNPTGEPVSARYVLNLQVTEARSAVLVTRTENVSRFNLSEALEYRLTDARSGELLTSGSMTSIASYNVVSAEFANLAAEEDARNRAARDLAELLRARLALYFERSAPPTQPPAARNG